MSSLIDLVRSPGFGFVVLLAMAMGWLAYGLRRGEMRWLDGDPGEPAGRNAGRGPYETATNRPDEYRNQEHR